MNASSTLLNVWKTIQVGTGIRAAAFCSELMEKGFQVKGCAADMFGREQWFKVFPENIAIDLVRCSVAELGLKDNARYDAISTRAREIGLELCPAEVGPQLRLQYPDQPRDEMLIVAMSYIAVPIYRNSIFYLKHNDEGLIVGGIGGNPDSKWKASDQFVFRLLSRTA